MTTSDWVMVFVVLAAPLLAVQAQKFIERMREKRQRKLAIFFQLMATRATRVAPQHVQALNMIDIEFYGRKIFRFRYQNRKEKKVSETWKEYHDHLNQPYKEDEFKLWVKRNNELFTDLLYEMAISLGFDFDKVQLKRGVYFPRAHDEQELAQLIIRDNLVKILTGDKALPMEIVSFPVSEEALDKQNKVQDSLLEYLAGDTVVKVKLVEDKD